MKQKITPLKTSANFYLRLENKLRLIEKRKQSETKIFYLLCLSLISIPFIIIGLKINIESTFIDKYIETQNLIINETIKIFLNKEVQQIVIIAILVSAIYLYFYTIDNLKLLKEMK